MHEREEQGADKIGVPNHSQARHEIGAEEPFLRQREKLKGVISGIATTKHQQFARTLIAQ
jgi:hypothetical protein